MAAQVWSRCVHEDFPHLNNHIGGRLPSWRRWGGGGDDSGKRCTWVGGGGGEEEEEGPYENLQYHWERSENWPQTCQWGDIFSKHRNWNNRQNMHCTVHMKWNCCYYNYEIMWYNYSGRASVLQKGGDECLDGQHPVGDPRQCRWTRQISWKVNVNHLISYHEKLKSQGKSSFL